MPDHSQPIVYVPQETSVPIPQATRFGEVRTILSASRQLLQSSGNMLKELREAFRDFSDDDYLLPMGSPVVMAMASFAAAEANDGRVRYLVYDKKIDDYYELSMDFYKGDDQ